MTRPFKILGVQQVAIGNNKLSKLLALWEDMLGLEVDHSFKSEKENVNEKIYFLGEGDAKVEIDLMEPLNEKKSPKVHIPPLNHIGLWVDNIEKAVEWLSSNGVRFASGGIRTGAGGHKVCFIHPKSNDEFPISGEGVLIELIEADRLID